jgi:hypothetical protein
MVGRSLLDPRLEVAARNVHRAGDASLLPLVALADIDQHGAFVEQRLRALRVGFFDLGLDGLEQIAVRRHRFRLYSEAKGPPPRPLLKRNSVRYWMTGGWCRRMLTSPAIPASSAAMARATAMPACPQSNPLLDATTVLLGAEGTAHAPTSWSRSRTSARCPASVGPL